MPNITYDFVDRCAGGGHTRFDVTLGGQTRRVVYPTDEIREPLANLTLEEKEQLTLLVLKVHMAGKTRAQIITELGAGPVTVTI